MALHYQATAYMYTTTRIRALENGIVGKEKTDRLLELHSVEAAEERLREYGIVFSRNQSGKIDREKTFYAILQDAFAVCDGAPQSARFRWLHDRYDCNNIKAILKSNLRQVSADSMLVPCGSVPIDRVKEAVLGGGNSLFPSHMGAAIAKASEACKQTGNPQLIDRYLDRACFADMAACAKQTPVAWFAETVAIEADLLNILLCVRILRMGDGICTVAGRELMKDSFLDGGTLSDKWLSANAEKGEEALGQALLYTPYDKLGAALKAGGQKMYVLECMADNLRMEHVRAVRHITCGAEAVAAYVIAKEYEVRNLRILLAGLDARLDSAAIRERMRNSYV